MNRRRLVLLIAFVAANCIGVQTSRCIQKALSLHSEALQLSSLGRPALLSDSVTLSF